ncbi:peptidase M14, partial [Candidatus Aminicenantes bacterium AC-335-L06]|nr:peptidase M14 [Candidatus Aminicenantes bacterium AC-335-L06]
SLNSFSKEITPPEKVLGFKIGEDFKIASWSDIVKYCKILSKESERVNLLTLGKSTLGRNFIMLVISSPINLNKVDEIKKIQKMLHDPRKISDEEAKKLAKEGKAVILISCSIHSTEIASSLMSMELAYKLASFNTPDINKILENVVLLLVPSVNPDGIDIVYNWYNKYLGTPYESSPLPWLYHYYTGHDNNRDWFMVTQKETRLLTKVYYHEWFPIVIYDVHQMGKYGPRLFIPPYYDPINPNIDPLLLRELYIITSQMAWDLTYNGKKGVATNAIFDAWYNMANRAAPLRHNVIGILSEAASVNIASPIFIRKDEIRLTRRGFINYEPQASYIDPWPGGWWRIRDIIDYEEIVSFSLLKTVANRKEEFLYNYYLFAKRQIEKGRSEPPFAYIVPLNQKDYPTALKLLEVLQKGGAEVYKALSSFKADGVDYPAGTWVIPLTQPYRAFIKDLLEFKVYPRKEIQPGILERPYDEASWTLPLQMGVKVVEIINPFNAELTLVDKIQIPKGKIIGKGNRYFILPYQTNDETKIINRLFSEGINPYVAVESFSLMKQSFSPGAIIVPYNQKTKKIILRSISELGVNVFSTNKEIKVRKIKMETPKIAIYQSWIANMDEGWLRWVLEKFEFSFKVIHNSEIKSGNLINRYNVIIIPNMSLSALIEGRKEGVPPEFRGGIGEEGIISLEEFVRNGGKLLTIGHSSELPIKYFNIKVKNLLSYRDFRRGETEEKGRIYCPGSILKVKVKNSHPVGYGFENICAIFFRNSPVFDVEKGEVIVYYPDYNPLLSGIIENDEKMYGKAAIVECSIGKGKIRMIGFKPIHRAQAHGTFKFVFNSIFF